MIAGLRAAIALGTWSEDVVALEARKSAQADGRALTVTPAAPDPPDPQLPQVSHLTAHRLARPLPEDARPWPAWSSGTNSGTNCSTCAGRTLERLG